LIEVVRFNEKKLVPILSGASFFIANAEAV